MKRVFADTYYWIALLNDKDLGHAAARAASATLHGAILVTTQEVLSEVLTHFSQHGAHVRQSAVAYVRGILNDPAIEVHAQSDASFLTGLALYEARPDKGYSLTDCVSMETMRREGITDVLTHDAHFAQEGFGVML